jgi:cell division septum initiation protein DivIVA
MRKKDEPASRFGAAKRGYDRSEVDEHIAELQARHESDTEELVRSVAGLELELEAAKEREEAVHLTLVAATRTKEEILESAAKIEDDARAAADRIMAEARFQAFRLVTDARQEGEELIGSAKRDAAKVSSIGSRLHHTDDGDHTELRHEEAALRTRVLSLRAAAEAIETRLRAFSEDVGPEVAGLDMLLAPHSPDSDRERLSLNGSGEREAPPSISPANGDIDREVARTAASETVVEPLDEGSVEPMSPATEDRREAPVPVERSPLLDGLNDDEPTGDGNPIEASAQDVVESAAPDEPEPKWAQRTTEAPTGDEPSPAALVAEMLPASDDSDTAIDEAETEGPEPKRGSFYSRRSAKLPRIGVEGGKGALAAMSELRSQLVTADADEDQDQEDGRALENV